MPREVPMKGVRLWLLVIFAVVTACSTDTGPSAAGVSGSSGPGREGPDTAVPRIANSRHLYDHTAADGVVTSVDLGDVTFAVHVPTESPTTAPCRQPCATTVGLLVSYRIPGGTSGKVPIADRGAPDEGPSGRPPATDVRVIASIGLSPERDGPSAVGIRVGPQVSRVSVDLEGGTRDELRPVDGWVAFVSAHPMTNLRAYDAAGAVLASCEPVELAPGCS